MPDPEQFHDFTFPIAGVNLNQEFELQPANTTPVGINVRAFEMLTGRGRGGSRAGLTKLIDALIVSPDPPIQHLAVVVNVTRGTLNKDAATGEDNAWTATASITDPSTNNRPVTTDFPAGRPARNQRDPDTGSDSDPRVIRYDARGGGSGRPEVRNGTATPVECISRRYTIRGEDTFTFTLTTDMLPLNFASIMATAGIGFTADDSLWVASGPQVPTAAEINAIAATDTGWVSAGATCTGIVDSACPE